MEQNLIKKPYDIIKIDKYTNKIQMPNLLLMTRSFDVIGKISNYTNWNISLVGNGIDEISFEVNKYVNGELCPVWNDLIDLKIIDVRGFGRFEISVDYTDNTQTVKSVHGISLETELAQIPLYEFHVNDDEAMTMEITEHNNSDFDENGNFIPTVFYHRILPDDATDEAEKKRKHSLLHRVLADKAPHWSIGYITPYITFSEAEQPESVETFQRTYTCDGTTIYDFLTGEVAKESNVIFTFDTMNRKINCYSLCDCIDRETGKMWAKGIGEDTNIFVSKNKLANEITISSNKDNVKNCFRVEGGDDVITDMVRVINMNGSNYIYQFADFQYNDMPAELKNKIITYQNNMSSKDIQDKYYGNGDIDAFINGTLTLLVTSEIEAATILNICKNNKIATSNTKISDYDGNPYWYIITSNNSKTLYLSNTQKSPYKSVNDAFNTMGIYQRLCEKYDELLYFESSMMPEVVISKTTAEEQYNIMVNELKNITVGVSSLNNYNDNLFVGVSNNVEAMANILIDARYKAEVIKDSASFSKNEKNEYIWTGNIQISREADETDFYPKNNTDAYQNTINVKVSDDELTFTKQKIEKALSKSSMLDIDFDMDEIWNDPVLTSEKKAEKIREYFNLYSLNRLKSFYDGYNSCLSILMSLPNTSSIRQKMYNKYYYIMQIISNPPTSENPNPILGILDIRQLQVDAINDEIKSISDDQKTFQEDENHNFQKFLGDELFIEFCKYRREDSYTNNNYISDGLSTSACLAKAKELVEAATKEAKKACVLQRTVSTSLNNLFALPEFEQLYDKFALFNYIRIRTEDEILKLRLIGVEFNGDSVSDIHVTFSEQIESVDGKTDDLTSIIQQAGSMAASFPSTVLQAKKGAEAQSTVSGMFSNGLNAANTMLTNNDNNEVTITPSGIICKRMDDEGYYGDKQLRMTGNMLAFTKDAWKNVSLAIGETTFENPITNETETSYGIIAENIVGKLMLSEQLGIYNDSGSLTFDNNGFAISNGINSFKVNPNSEVLLSISNEKQDVFYIDNQGQLHITPVDEMKKAVISNVDVLYALSNSPTISPTDDWSTQAPEWKNGMYMWQKTVTTYANGESIETAPINISGAKGDTGTTGNGIKSTDITYQSSSSGTTVPTGTWLTNIPDVNAGNYLWTKTVITYTDKTTSTSYSVGMMGQTGLQGIQGEKGEQGIPGEKGDKGDKGDTGTQGINLIINSNFSRDSFNWTIGNNMNISYDTDSIYGRYLIVSCPNAGDTNSNRFYTNIFSTGISHEFGKTYTLSFYAKASVETGIHAGYINNLKSINITTEWKKYVTTYIVTGGSGSLTFYIDTANVELYITKIKLEEGEVGNPIWTPAVEDLQGENGIDGIGISSVQEQYYMSSSDTEPPNDEDEGWKISYEWEDGKFLWTRSIVEYTDGSFFKTTPVLANGFNTIHNELSNQIKANFNTLSDMVEINFINTKETIGALDENVQELCKYVHFTSNGIEIGDSDSGFTLTLDNDNISFRKNGEEFGRWDGENFHTGNIIVDVHEKAQFGNFAFVPRSDGSLSFLKVGE